MNLNFKLTSVFFLCVFFFSPLCFSQSSETIDSIEIESQLQSRQADILSIIRMQKGEKFEFEKMERAIEDLRKWGVFKTVEVLLKHKPNSLVDVVFQLEDAYLIRDVEIHGNYPLLEKKVKRAIFLTKGDIFSSEKIPEQIGRLIEFYEKEGYSNTVVYIDQYKNEKERSVLLKIRIAKGKGFKIGEIQVEGNTVFNRGRILNKISRFFGYKANKLKENVLKIEKMYQKAGYPRVKVKVENLEFNEEKREVSFKLKIREGKKLELEFAGNDHFKSKRLKALMEVSQSGDVDEFEIDLSKKQLLQFYKEMGFLNVQVTHQLLESHKNFAHVLFVIEEGPRQLVKSISFEGNEQKSDKELKEQLFTQEHGLTQRGIFLEEVFTKDLQNIEKYYQSEGFLESKVEDWKKEFNQSFDRLSLKVYLQEGKRTSIRNLSFEGLKVFNQEALLSQLVLREGKGLSTRLLEEDVRKLLLWMSEKGYPHAEVKTKLVPATEHEVDLIYQVVEGPAVKVGKILIEGNYKTKEASILNALHFKTGDAFNPTHLLNAQSRLRTLAIFDSVTLETLGLEGKENEVHVVIRVEEKKDKLIDLSLSYDTDTSAKAKLDYRMINLLGRAKKLDLKATAGLRLNRGEFIYTDPSFWGSDFQFLASSYVQHEKRTFFVSTQWGAYLGWLKQFGSHASLSLKQENTYVNFDEAHTNFALLRPGSQDNITSKLKLSFVYEGRDNFGDPHSGIYVGAGQEIGGQFKSLDSYFLKSSLQLGYWWSPFSSFTIANSFRGTYLKAIQGDAVLPVQELIFLGGDDSIRGFKQDALLPAGGRVSFVHNLEFQLRLFKGFEAVAFVDSASLTNAFSQINLGSLRHSAGAGLRYVTPVGPLRLDYGFILDRKTDEEMGRLHFTFGYFF